MKRSEYLNRAIYYGDGFENPCNDADVVIYRTIHYEGNGRNRKEVISHIHAPVLAHAINWSNSGITGLQIMGRIYDYVVLDRYNLKLFGRPVRFDGEGFLMPYWSL